MFLHPLPVMAVSRDLSASLGSPPSSRTIPSSLKVLEPWLFLKSSLIHICIHFLGLLVKGASDGWPKTRHTDSLVVLDARSSKSRWQQGHVPSEGSRVECFLASSSLCWLSAFLGFWHPHCSLSLLLMVVFCGCVFVSESPPLVKALAIGCRVHLSPI